MSKKSEQLVRKISGLVEATDSLRDVLDRYRKAKVELATRLERVDCPPSRAQAWASSDDARGSPASSRPGWRPRSTTPGTEQAPGSVGGPPVNG